MRITERPVATGDSKQQASCSDLALLMLDQNCVANTTADREGVIVRRTFCT